jgi:hypothetical protein
MTKPIFEEEGQAPAAGMATAQQKIEKQARQLAYDTRYQVKKEIGEKKVNPAAMKRFLLQRLQKSTAAPNVKLRAKQMLLGEDYIGDVNDFASGTVANALFKVFVEGTQEVSEEIELQYLKELEEVKERKYKVRVTDKKTGNSYVRYATREKITQLRTNPNIKSVEMTEYGEPREGERKSGEQTAAAKAGKDYDGDGKIESGAKEYRGAVHNAIQRKKGGTPDGQDTSSVKEEFLADAATEDSNDKEITGKGVNNYKGKNPAVKIMPEDPTSQTVRGPRSVYAHTELEGEVITEKAVSRAQQKFMGMVYAAKKGEKPASPEVAKAAAGMSKKEAKKFAKTKHEGLPTHKEEKDCGCEEESKMKDRENDMEDMRGVKTKMNLVKNKLRAMGLKMSYEPEGEKIDEIAPLVAGGLAAAGALGAMYAAKKSIKSGKDAAQSGAKVKPSQGTLSGAAYGLQKRKQEMDSAIKQLNQSFEPEGEQIDERRREKKGTPRPPEPSAAFKTVSAMMGAGRMGVQPRGQKKEPGKKPPSAGEYGAPESPAQKVAKRRAAAQRSQDMMHSRFD